MRDTAYQCAYFVSYSLETSSCAIANEKHIETSSKYYHNIKTFQVDFGCTNNTHLFLCSTQLSVYKVFWDRPQLHVADGYLDLNRGSLSPQLHRLDSDIVGTRKNWYNESMKELSHIGIRVNNAALLYAFVL